MRTADVVFTSSALTADDIATFDNAVGDPLLQRRHGLRRCEGRRGEGHPGLELPDLEQRGGLGPRGAPGPRRPAPAGAVRDGRRAGRLGVYKWPVYQELHRIRSRTIGIIGLGRIGHLIAQKLMGFKPTIIAYDPYISASRFPEVELVSLDELCCPGGHHRVVRGADRDLARIINAEILAKTKPGVLIVNVSRGGIVGGAGAARRARFRVMSRMPRSTSVAGTARTRPTTS